MRAYIASIRAKKGEWVVTKVAKPDVDIVAWWQHKMLMLTTDQMRRVGVIEGPYWENGKQIEGPYPQMALFLTGFVR